MRKVEMEKFRNFIFKEMNYLDLSLIQIGEQRCDPLYSFGPIIRNHYMFHYVLSGKGTYINIAEINSTDEDSCHVKAGEGFLINPGDKHVYFADEEDPWHYIWLEFDGMKASEFLNQAGLSKKQIHYTFQPEAKAEKKAIADNLLYILDHPNNADADLIGHLYLFFHALVQGSATKYTKHFTTLKDFYVNEAVKFIHDHFEIIESVEDIAAFCNLNRNYLGKIFKESMHVSLQEYLINYRLKKACELLRSSRLPIGEISYRIGYVNALNFSRAFCKKYGISPRQWRLENKQIL